MEPLSSLDLLKRLVAFDTTSRESNLGLIDFIRNYLDDLGVASELTFDDEGRKANLYATIGPDDRGGILLSGHTDVVPVDGQDWQGDPFEVAEKEGKLIGRGVADMKSFIAVVLAAAPRLTQRRLRQPVHLGFTYDEEVGCIGVGRLVKSLEHRAIKPVSCIIGEPTSMRPVNGHKGRMALHCRVHGRATHSALAHEGVNAIEAAAELVAFLKQMARRFRREGPFNHDLIPPYTTVQTGKISGGIAVNIVPRDAEFHAEIRTLPGQDACGLLQELHQFAKQHVLPEMHEVDASTGIDVEVTSNFAGLDTSEDADITQLALSLTGANGVSKVSFGTEGGVYQEAGIPTIICGPGSIEQAHKPDEWIDIDQIRRCEQFVTRLADYVART